VNFMNNPDEKTAVEQFGKENKYFGACVLLVTMPGLPMLGHGQVEGFHEKYGMEYKTAYWNEAVDEHLVREHERRIFPLMRRRWLFSGAENFVFYDFRNGNHLNENVFAFSNRAGEHRAIILYHNRFASTAGHIRESTSFAVKGDSGEMELRRTTLGDALGFKGDGRHYYLFRDYAADMEYIRNGRELCEQGMFVEMEAYECHAFLDFREIWDDEYGTWGRLCHQLEGRPVSSIDEEVKQVRFAGLLDRLRKHLDGNGGLLTGAFGEIPKATLIKARKKFQADLQEFLDAVAEQAEMRVVAAGTVPALTRELSLLEKEALRTGSLLDGLTSRLLAFAWLSLHRLGEMTSEADLPAATAELVSRFGLTRPLEEELYGEAAESGDHLALLDVPSVVALFRVLLGWQGFMALTRTERLQKLPGLLSDRDAAMFIGRHESGGHEWFIRERWEILLDWLQLVASVSCHGDAVAGKPTPGQLSSIKSGGRLLKEMGASAGYRMDLILAGKGV
jgi:hypothetical protein